jgi:hypothetical protein
MQGLRSETLRSVSVEVGQRVRADFTLQPGQVTETVEVTADAPLVQNESSTLVFDLKKESEFGRSCLMARRLVERGVRFVQLYDSPGDHHSDIMGHKASAAQVDGPIAGPQRPRLQVHAFTVLLAGGGVKAGSIYGVNDDFGFKVVDNPVHVHDLHARS